jgi:hypothetical protein
MLTSPDFSRTKFRETRAQEEIGDRVHLGAAGLEVDQREEAVRQRSLADHINATSSPVP